MSIRDGASVAFDGPDGLELVGTIAYTDGNNVIVDVPQWGRFALAAARVRPVTLNEQES